MSSSTLRIPIMNDKDIIIFSDELGNIDYNDVIDALRAEFAPLEVWRKCAVCSIHLYLLPIRICFYCLYVIIFFIDIDSIL